MKNTKKEKKNFNFTVGLVQEFNDKCVPEGSNASVEIERLLRAELRRCDVKGQILDYLFTNNKQVNELSNIKAMIRGINLLEQFEKNINPNADEQL